jgi:hypothetical protein
LPPAAARHAFSASASSLLCPCALPSFVNGARLSPALAHRRPHLPSWRSHELDPHHLLQNHI